MNDEKRCDECRALIDAPSTVEPHAGLHRYGVSVVFADFNSDTYECDICHTKFQRQEAKSSRKVTWTVE